ncbi:hypothetical protein Tco_0027300 [Tanacetum coccineum]
MPLSRQHRSKARLCTESVDHLVCWAAVGDSQLTGPEINSRKPLKRSVQIVNNLQAAGELQRSYANARYLTIGKQGKATTRTFGHSNSMNEWLKQYIQELPEELS